MLNAADKYNPAWLIPPDVINTQGFLVDTAKGGWMPVKEDSDIYKNTVAITAAITENGTMNGKAVVSNYGYSKNVGVQQWKENKKAFNDFFTKPVNGVTIVKTDVSNADADTLPLVQKVQFSLAANSAGDYLYFPVNLFLGLGTNPFIEDERWTDVDYGYKKSFQLTAAVTIPAGYEFNELPKDAKMMMSDTSLIVKRTMQVNGNLLNVTLSVDFLHNFYPAVKYAEFQKFYKNMFALLDEQVVVKKKKT